MSSSQFLSLTSLVPVVPGAAGKYTRQSGRDRLRESGMRFAQVIGVLYPDGSGYRLVVTLDMKSDIKTVRDERIARLMTLDGVSDPRWTVDQLTQETIGTTLAEQGWEVVAQQPNVERESALPIASYLVRS
jgi:hypothetical protein